MEGTMARTPEGKLVWAYQLKQLKEATHRTFGAGAVIALENAQPRHQSIQRRYNISDSMTTCFQKFDQQASEIGILQKPDIAFPFNDLILSAETEFGIRDVTTTASQMYVLLSKGMPNTIYQNARNAGLPYMQTGRKLMEPVDGQVVGPLGHVPPDHLIEIAPLNVGTNTGTVPLLKSQITVGEFDVLRSNPPTAGSVYFRTDHCNSFIRDEMGDNFNEMFYANAWNNCFFFNQRPAHDVSEVTDPGHPPFASSLVRSDAPGRFLNAYGAVFFSPCFDYGRFQYGAVSRSVNDDHEIDGLQIATGYGMASVNDPSADPTASIGSNPSLKHKLRLWEAWMAKRQMEATFLKNAIGSKFTTWELIRGMSDKSPVHILPAEVGTVGEFYEFHAGIRHKTKFEHRVGTQSMRKFNNRPAGNDVDSSRKDETTQRGCADEMGVLANDPRMRTGNQNYSNSLDVWNRMVMSIARLRKTELEEFFKFMPTIDSVKSTDLTELQPKAGTLEFGETTPTYDGRLLLQKDKERCINQIVSGNSAAAARDAVAVVQGASFDAAIPVDHVDHKADADKEMKDVNRNREPVVPAPSAFSNRQPTDYCQELVRILLRAWPILTNDFFRMCHRFDVPIGMDILVARPFITLEGEDMVIIAGANVGTTWVGFPNASLAYNGVIKQATLTFSVHHATIVDEPDKVLVKHCVAITGYKGGGSMQFFRPSRETAAELASGKFKASAFSLPLSPGETMIGKTWIDIRGRFSNVIVRSQEQDAPHYSTAELANAFYQFPVDRAPSPWFNQAGSMSGRHNTICSEGQSYLSTCSSGLRGEVQWTINEGVVEHKGARAGLVMKGARKITDRGVLLKKSPCHPRLMGMNVC